MSKSLFVLIPGQNVTWADSEKNSQGVQLQTKMGSASDQGGSGKVLPKVKKANGMPTFLSNCMLIRQNKQF